MQRLNRIVPRLGAGAFKTYQLASPLSTHYRSATCTEVDCSNQVNGWKTVIDESTELGQRQAHYIRAESKRQFTESRDPAGLTVFEFPSGQTCFADHRASLDRPELYIVRDGDWRGNPRGTRPRRHTRPEHWVEDFAEHQQTLADIKEQG